MHTLTLMRKLFHMRIRCCMHKRNSLSRSLLYTIEVNVVILLKYITNWITTNWTFKYVTSIDTHYRLVIARSIRKWHCLLLSGKAPFIHLLLYWRILLGLLIILHREVCLSWNQFLFLFFSLIVLYINEI